MFMIDAEDINTFFVSWIKKLNNQRAIKQFNVICLTTSTAIIFDGSFFSP
jgi:hypothetical protein